MRPFACLLLGMVLASPVAAADGPAAFGHVRYTVPPGWRETRYANAVLLAPAPPPKGQQLDLTIMPARAFPGTMAKALEASWDDVCAQSGATKKRTVDNKPYTIQTEERTSFKGWVYVRAQGMVTATADGGEYYVNLTVIRVGDRIERFAVMSKQLVHNVTRYCLYDSPTFQRAVDEFLFSLRFDDWTDARVEPATLKGGGVIGVWNGIGLFGGQYKSAYAIFFSNGQVFYGSRFPHGGLADFDTWVDAELVPRYWGTYTFADGAGVITMPTGRFPFKATAAGLTLTPIKLDHKYVRVPAVDGATFSGTYAAEAFNVRLPTITFTPDGRFVDDGVLNVLDHSVPYPFKLTALPGRGTYAVRDYTVLFAYDDGRRYPVAFPGIGYEKTNPGPAKLEMGFNSDTLKRR